MALIIGNDKLTTEKLLQVARLNEKIELHSDAIIRINKCRKMLEEKIQSQETIYSTPLQHLFR